MANVTTKLLLDKRYEKVTGKYPVLLRVTHDRKKIYLPVKENFSDAEWNILWGVTKGAEKFKTARTRLVDFESEVRRVINTIPAARFTLPEFKQEYENKDKITGESDSLEKHFKKSESAFWNRDQVKTAMWYKNAFHSINEFRPNLMITDINSELLKDYQHWMKKEGNSLSTVSFYMRALRAVINRAMDSGNFPSERKYYPFGKNKYKIPAPLQKKKTLSSDQLTKLIKYKPKSDEKAFARDMFLFSYYCGGTNPVDIAKFQYEWIKGSHIHFPLRSKIADTSSEQLPVPPVLIDDELNAIINKWKKGNGKPKEFVFGILKDKLDAKQIVEKVNAFNKAINAGLKEIAKDDLKFDCVPTMGFARATQANDLRQAGVSVEEIAKTMGHASPKTTKIYLTQLPTDLENNTLAKLRRPKLKAV